MSIVSHFPIPKGPKIIVANHPTTTDPFILTTISSGHTSVLIKGILFEVPIFGKYLRWAGHIPVIKNNGKYAFKKALSFLKKNMTIIVFIEGNLSKVLNKINKPKTGAVRLALLSKAPIIPIGISVLKKNIKCIKSRINGTIEWGKWYFRGPYTMTIGKPIFLKGNVKKHNNVKKLSNFIAKKILFLANESASRLKKLKYNYI